MSCLPCLVNPIADCFLCKKHLCLEDTTGHRGSYHKGKKYCRECWWKVWERALEEARLLSASGQHFYGRSRDAFAQAMGYTEEDKGYL